MSRERIGRRIAALSPRCDELDRLRRRVAELEVELAAIRNPPAADLLPAALQRLGYSASEVRRGVALAGAGELADRLRRALAGL